MYSRLWLGLKAWRWMFIMMALPAILYGALAFTIPESPRYLVAKFRIPEARRVLTVDLVRSVASCMPLRDCWALRMPLSKSSVRALKLATKLPTRAIVYLLYAGNVPPLPGGSAACRSMPARISLVSMPSNASLRIAGRR
jgi:MFS family permease